MSRLAASLILAAGLAVLASALVGAGDDPPAAKLPPIPRVRPKEPDEALRTFRALDGFRIERLAAEPLVLDPVAGAYDEDGRLYVAEMADYPYVDKAHDRPNEENRDDPPLGRVRLLMDRDGDGRFDQSTLFADQLSWPTGVAIWKGGVFVAATPDIWYLKDTDGDGRADVRRKVFTGFRKLNVQAVMNNLQWGLDHEIYGAASGNGGQVRPAGQPDANPVPVLRRDFRFDPNSEALEAISGGARFGNTFDDWGNRFLCDIRNPAEHVVLPARYLARNPYLPTPRVLHDAAVAGDTLPVFRISPPEPWRELRARRWVAAGKVLPRSELVGAGYVTSSSGVTIYRGDAYPERYRGNLFLGEVAGNLIHRQTVEPDGVTFRANRADPNAEFVASADIWFRPVNFINAPDGTLHVLDMYRETIEHPWSIPDDIKAQLDLRSGSDRGRIYRLAPPGFQPKPPPRLSKASTSELVRLLEHPNGWHRDTAHRLLFERQDQAAVEPLRSLVRSSTSPLGRLHALWSLEGLHALDEATLLVALGDRQPGVREHAVRLAERLLAGSRSLSERILDLAGDANIRVRFQVAFSLGEMEDPRAIPALARIAHRDPGDAWIRTAVLSSAGRAPVALFEKLLQDPKFAASTAGVEWLRALARMAGVKHNAADDDRLLSALFQCGAVEDHPAMAIDIVAGLAEGLSRAGQPIRAETVARPSLSRLVARAETLATDPNAPLDERERAITLLGYAGFAQGTPARLLDPKQPQHVQVAAVRALGQSGKPEVAETLLHGWNAYTPTVRSEVIQVLVGRRQWIGTLLDAIDARTVAASQIPAARRSLLLSNRDPAIRDRARVLLNASASGSRDAVIARYRSALQQPGDPERGRPVFERECAACHRVGQIGQAVGPNLASVQHRSAEELLVSILDPNREVAPDYLEYTVALDDGRVVSGLIVTETTSSLTLRKAQAAEETILRQNIEEITSTGKSLMPEALEQQVTPQEMVDVLAFVLEIQK